MLLGRWGECELLDQALADARAGRSRVVVLRGEAGAGKSALLDYLRGRVTGWHVATAVGVESEIEFAYSGLHQLCTPILDRLDRLPTPQRSTLATVFGLETGPAPDRFMVALATLTLLAEVAEDRPLLCVIDDAQWLDAGSAQVAAFVARRLAAERIALVCASRSTAGDDAFSGLPELFVDGLPDDDARRLLLENVHGPIDAGVCDRIVAESHGNPLALLELPRTWTADEFAGGFGHPKAQPLVSRIEQSFGRRLNDLPAETQLFLLAAAAEPLGDPLLLFRAAEALGLELPAADPAVEADLINLGRRIEFAHPLVRSVAYHSAASADRQRVHRALAEATDRERDPDRRAWHLAGATAEPAEEVALELEESAGRAQSRGGVAAAAAFLELAAKLSPDPERRAKRALRAAAAKQLAGAAEAALGLVAMASAGPLDQADAALAQRLTGQIFLDQRRVEEAVPFLLDAARRLERVEPALARETYLEALRAASVGSRLSHETLREVATAARTAPRSSATRAVDLLVEGLAVRFTDGYVASVPLLQQALSAVCAEGGSNERDVRWPWLARRVAPDLFDDEAFHLTATRSLELARERGALGVLPMALHVLAIFRTLEGHLDAAEALLDESDRISDAIRVPRVLVGRPVLAGFRGDAAAVSKLVEVDQPLAIGRGEGVLLTFAEHARAVLGNGLGRHEEALVAAASASERDELWVSTWSLPELVEAAARAGRADAAAAGLERLSERTQATRTPLALGVEARSRALVSEGAEAEALYRDALHNLSRCRFASELARAHLVYGEWLRRNARRSDSCEQLQVAHEMLARMGMHAFTERARRELIAAGANVRKREAETRSDLTAQEAQIAQLASEGYSNPEIAAQLFLSPRTIEWHLRKVFAKLDVSSRKDIGAALRSKPERETF